MINLNSISRINDENNYFYVFHEKYGSGFFYKYYTEIESVYYSGDGYGNGFGLSNGDGHSFSLKNLIQTYKND